MQPRRDDKMTWPTAAVFITFLLVLGALVAWWTR